MNQGKWFIKQGIILSLLSIAVAIFSFVKEAVFANYFGTSSAADAYTIAIQIPEILFAVVWNAINAIVIPLYTEKYYKEGKKEASYFISNLVMLFSLGAIVLLVFEEIFADEIIFLFSPGLTGETHDLAVSLMRCILPMLFFEGIIRISVGILNVHEQFIAPKFINTIRNIGVIVGLTLFAKKFGVFVAAYGLLSGIIIECIVCLIFTFKYEKYQVHLDFKDPSLRKAGKMTIPVIIGIGASDINQIADKMVASFLDSGSISSLNYATKLSSIVEVIFLSNIVTLMYPTYSKLISTGKMPELAQAYTKTIKTTILISMPIVFGGAFLCNEIVSLAFKRGVFDDSSAMVVGGLFAFYLIGCLFNTIRLVAVKLFTAFCDTRTPMINSMAGAMLNVILNIALSYYLGAVGLALATTISTGVVGLILLKQVKAKVVEVEYKSTVVIVVKSMAAALVMSIILFGIKRGFLSGVSLNAAIPVLVYVLFSVVVGALAYVLMLFVLKIPEVQGLYKEIKKRFRG
ncbi:murein biosynthesis integral membrane protein MurJ [Lachnospiraceae bacterium]|nr:murein biosynthesis integral membrane protein MurJ [Lachnospiraceae bacterium]